MTRRLLDEIAKRVLVCDGAMGTMLYSKGVYFSSCFDELNLSNPELVEQVHRDYVSAGADIIETNTFGANRYKLRGFGLDDKVAEINRAGVEIARAAAGEGTFVAGSMGPLGVRIEPWGPTPAADAERAFAEQAGALLGAGVAFIILETFSDINEIHIAIKAVRGIAARTVVVAQMTIEEDGNSLYGTGPDIFTCKMEEWGANVIGVNCSVGPAHMHQCIEKMAEVTDLPLSAMPNAGVPREIEGRNFYLCSPEYMAEYAKRFILSGVRIIGGCCGTTPAHTRAMVAAVRALEPPCRQAARTATCQDQGAVGSQVAVSEKSQLARRLADGGFAVSVEIVPPRGHDSSRAVAAARMLKEHGVDCVNIPDGPRATARMSPMALASILVAEAGIEPLLHYTCRDRNLLGMQSDLLGVFAQGIRNLLIITGDPPKLGDYPDATAVFDVDSIGLAKAVALLNRGIDIGGRKLSPPTAFLIGVGANPGALNRDHEISRFRRKVEAGAEFAITQPVFDATVLEDFLESIKGFQVPILAGIWPLVSLRNAEFMRNEVPGASVPDSVMERMRRAQDRGPEAAREEGIAIARETIRMVKGLVQGVQISPPQGNYDLVARALEGQ